MGDAFEWSRRNPVLVPASFAVVTAILSPIVQMAYARVYLENRETRAEGAGTVDNGWTGGDREASESDDAWGHEDGWDAESDDRDDTHW